MRTPTTVLVVEGESGQQERLMAAVSRTGNIAAGVSSCEAVKQRAGRRAAPILLFSRTSWRTGGPALMASWARSSTPVRAVVVLHEREMRRAEEIRAEGAHLVLQDPISPAELMLAIDELLARPWPPAEEGDEVASPVPNGPTEDPESGEWIDPDRARAAVKSLGEELANGRAKVSDVSQAAVEVSALLGDPSTDVAALVRGIQRDPNLVVSVLRASNTPVFRGMPQVSDLEEAGRRLGVRRLGELAQRHALRGAFAQKGQGWSRLTASLWRSSVVTAEACRALGERAGVRAPGALYTFGLLHNLGQVLLIDLYKSLGCPRPLGSVATGSLAWALGEQHAELGALLLKSWRMPSAAVLVTRHQDAPDAVPAGTPLSRHLWLAAGAIRAVHDAGCTVRSGEPGGVDPGLAGAALGFSSEWFREEARDALDAWNGNEELDL